MGASGLSMMSTDVSFVLHGVMYAYSRRIVFIHVVNIGKWVLKNLFNGFIREQMRIATRESERQSALKTGHWSLGTPTPRPVAEGTGTELAKGKILVRADPMLGVY
jgi:hypothetical protein